MKFRFCGDQDGPDWVLLEISVLSLMDTKKIAVMTNEIMSVCLKGGFDEEAILKIAEANTEENIFNIKGVIAAIHFMIRLVKFKSSSLRIHDANNNSTPINRLYSLFHYSNAAKYDVDELSLSTEIQQLGLPKKNADIISNAFLDSKDKLREIHANESFRLSKLLDCDWRIDQVLGSSDPDIGMSFTNTFYSV